MFADFLVVFIILLVMFMLGKMKVEEHIFW